MCVGDHVRFGHVPGRPLPSARGAFDQLPFMAEQRVEIAIVPRCRIGFPSAFDTAGNRVNAPAAAKAVCPAEPHLFDRRAFWLPANLGRVTGTVRFAKGMAASDQGDRLLVVHGHPGEGLSDVSTGGNRVGRSIGSLRIDIDQTHLHRREGARQLTVAAVARVAEPGVFSAPVDVFFGFPDIDAPPAEAEGLEPHGFQSAVASQDH